MSFNEQADFTTDGMKWYKYLGASSEVNRPYFTRGLYYVTIDLCKGILKQYT